MSESLIPRKSERGWVVTMTQEMSREAEVAEESFLVFHLSKNEVSAEILPPPTNEMKQSVQESLNKFADAFAELKRLGD